MCSVYENLLYCTLKVCILFYRYVLAQKKFTTKNLSSCLVINKPFYFGQITDSSSLKFLISKMNEGLPWWHSG